MAGVRRTDKRLWWLLGVAATVSVVWLLLTFWLVGYTLEADTRAVAWHLIGNSLVLVSLTWAIGMAAIAYGLKRWFDHWVTPSVQLAEEARVLLRTDVVRELRPKGNVETRDLAKLFNQLVAQREALRHEMDERVKEAAQNIEQERLRLAALMSELTQSVVVCNLDGRILLYNNRARMQFRAMSAAPRLADGAELIGIGRSIYTVFDRKLVVHALERVRQRLQRGAAQPVAQFVTTTKSGQLLRVQMAPVRAVQATEDNEAEGRLSGFVLMLENITRDLEQASERERLLMGLTEGSRAALANILMALEMLEYPDLKTPDRERFLGVVRAEVKAMSRRVKGLLDDTAASLTTRWPMEDMLGTDLTTAAVRRIEESLGLTVVEHISDAQLWLRIESYSILQALLYLAGRLQASFGVESVLLRLRPSAQGRQKAELDLAWTHAAGVTVEQVSGWDQQAMQTAQEVSSLSVQDVVERHAGAFWFEREQQGHGGCFRFLLPAVAAQEPSDSAAFVRNESRPEYYDFDLFRSTPASQALEDMPLTELAYTVFDTETTGLDPAQGDEIIQIGATRIFNGKLLKRECFDQLVDPGCIIPAASIPIHGITPDMVAGQPRITEVLPAFHAFAQDTVLVAHNAAFDMRFLQLKEQATGLMFDQPVLDTLLLSAVVHPNQDSHRLEAIAERFNVNVIGRHTAVGDAMVTAEVFLKLIPLLAEMGIQTLGQARAAAQQTYYARLKY
jgi:DNA polymerase-3 subunit epsilon